MVISYLLTLTNQRHPWRADHCHPHVGRYSSRRTVTTVVTATDLRVPSSVHPSGISLCMTVTSPRSWYSRRRNTEPIDRDDYENDRISTKTQRLTIGDSYNDITWRTGKIIGIKNITVIKLIII